MFIKRNSIQISPQEYQALLRKDFYSFIERAFYEINPETQFLPNWHIEKIAQELEECRLGNTKRLIINLPPRSLKSHCASVAFPAWLLGHNPSAQTICVSYGQDLVEQRIPTFTTATAAAMVPGAAVHTQPHSNNNIPRWAGINRRNGPKEVAKLNCGNKVCCM